MSPFHQVPITRLIIEPLSAQSAGRLTQRGEWMTAKARTLKAAGIQVLELRNFCRIKSAIFSMPNLAST